jgi:hypothetical protein
MNMAGALRFLPQGSNDAAIPGKPRGVFAESTETDF